MVMRNTKGNFQISFAATSTGGAIDDSPRRQPWENAAEKQAPAGATDNHALDRSSVAPSGASVFSSSTHGSRRGLTSTAAPQLRLILKTRPNLAKTTRRSGLLMTEVMVALAIVGIAILPLAYSFAQENKYLRRCYERAVAMEIVDGEMEIIRAGGWHNFTNGTHTITTTARSATNLPPGELRLTLSEKHARVEWLPAETSHGSAVVREATLK